MRTWDTDGDGTITRDEFKGPDRFWSRLDQDADGTVAYGSGRGPWGFKVDEMTKALEAVLAGG